MNKEEFKQELEKHDLDMCSFLDLCDAWNHLSFKDRLELLKGDNHE